MFWRCQRFTDLVMVYGFLEENQRLYDTVLTLKIVKNATLGFGFLSRISLDPITFKSLWSYLESIIPTPYLYMEVLPEHARVYAKYIPVEEQEQTISFDNIPCVLLKIRMKQNEYSCPNTCEKWLEKSTE